MRSLQIIAAAAALACLAAVPVAAQCGINDGFSAGPCCTPANPMIPQFPPVQQTGTGACILNCNVESQYSTTVMIQPQQVLCDYWLFQIQITGPGFSLGGVLVGKYARTWMEHPTAASQIQVWRLLLNGDLQYVFPTPPPPGGCPIPLSALPPYNMKVWFMGSIDFARNCQTNTWSTAYNLTHLCPSESHAPYSTRFIAAAAGWAKRTYHFVGPANFSFASLCPPPDGTVIAESVRTSIVNNPIAPYLCLNESQVMQGMLMNNYQDCSCYTPIGVVAPQRYRHQTLNTGAICNGLFSPINSIPVPFAGSPIPTGLRALTLGSYLPSTSNPYPGQECVHLYLGLIEHPDLCGFAPYPLNIVAGVGTTGGHPATLFDGPGATVMVNEFLDFSNMLIVTSAGTLGPGFGQLYVSDMVWNLNSL